MRIYTQLMIAVVLIAALAGCGAKSDSANNGGSEASGTKKVMYLGQEYEVPAKPQRIAVLSAEAMEELRILGVKPAIGAKDLYVNGVPEEIGDYLDGVEWIDSYVTPDKEQLLALQPDLILSTARLDAEVLKPLADIAPTIPLSFDGADSEANITLVGELTGKTEEAKKAVADYQAELQQAKEQLADSDVKDKTVMFLRISTENGLGAYSATTTYNQVLYDGLGLKVPDVIAKIERRETLPLEVLAQVNPDYIFALVPLNDLKAIDDLGQKPLWNQIQAVKDGHVIVNPINPDLFGTPTLSKSKFLEQVKATLIDAK